MKYLKLFENIEVPEELRQMIYKEVLAELKPILDAKFNKYTKWYFDRIDTNLSPSSWLNQPRVVFSLVLDDPSLYTENLDEDEIFYTRKFIDASSFREYVEGKIIPIIKNFDYFNEIQKTINHPYKIVIFCKLENWVLRSKKTGLWDLKN
jgi:hypothetical protein